MYLHNLQTVLPDFKSNQAYILTRWVQKHHVVQFLQRYDIKPNLFIEEYALRLISNMINIVENDFPIYQYLVTKEFLVCFADKDINAQDVFSLYQSLKDVCIELIDEGDILSAGVLLNKDKIIIDIYKAFEKITEDILYFYAEELHRIDMKTPDSVDENLSFIA